jgi:hypothetical protein
VADVDAYTLDGATLERTYRAIRRLEARPFDSPLADDTLPVPRPFCGWILVTSITPDANGYFDGLIQRYNPNLTPRWTNGPAIKVDTPNGETPALERYYCERKGRAPTGQSVYVLNPQGMGGGATPPTFATMPYSAAVISNDTGNFGQTLAPSGYFTFNNVAFDAGGYVNLAANPNGFQPVANANYRLSLLVTWLTQNAVANKIQIGFSTLTVPSQGINSVYQHGESDGIYAQNHFWYEAASWQSAYFAGVPIRAYYTSTGNPILWNVAFAIRRIRDLPF